MASKDLYEDLLKFYEFLLGKLPNRPDFKAAVQATIQEEDLKIFFLLPFMGQLTYPKLEKKALRAGLTAEELAIAVNRLIPEGLITTYHKDGIQVYERASFLTTMELQVRKAELSGQTRTPIQLAMANFMDLMIDGGAVANVPTRTPYYRVLPVEATITGQEVNGEIVVDAVVPDPRAVLPIDQVTEMVRKQPLIALSDCYCRKARQILDKGCDHPLETCFYFNELAELQLNAGRARQVTYEEAMEVIKMAEEIGLVHNVNNAEGKIHSLCNCCPCSCGVLKAVQRGATNAGASSRFIMAQDWVLCTQCGICAGFCPSLARVFDGEALSITEEKCIGCGLCVSHCPEGAVRMVPRPKPAAIPETVDKMYARMNREAVIGLVAGKFKRS